MQMCDKEPKPKAGSLSYRLGGARHPCNLFACLISVSERSWLEAGELVAGVSRDLKIRTCRCPINRLWGLKDIYRLEMNLLLLLF